MELDLGIVLEQTKKAVVRAGGRIRRDIRKPKNVTRKARIDLVTETDVAVEKQLKTSLAKILPEAGFLAEEGSGSTRPGKLTWIVDPVDGTTNFAHAFPFVCVSVALWREDKIVLGVIHAPVLGELFWASHGQGAFLNGEPIEVSGTTTLVDSLVATGFPYDIELHIEGIMANLRRVLLASQGFRRPGAAALDLAYVACGRFDGFYESDLKPWDIAAGWLIVEEAGGLVSRYDWREKSFLGAPSILATNRLVHHELSGLLEEHSLA
jgi:myo-inositol-1(or 4)-monophosphatase